MDVRMSQLLIDDFSRHRFMCSSASVSIVCMPPLVPLDADSQVAVRNVCILSSLDPPSLVFGVGQ